MSSNGVAINPLYNEACPNVQSTECSYICEGLCIYVLYMKLVLITPGTLSVSRSEKELGNEYNYTDAFQLRRRPTFRLRFF